jgi:hypothetical protein
MKALVCDKRGRLLRQPECAALRPRAAAAMTGIRSFFDWPQPDAGVIDAILEV